MKTFLKILGGMLLVIVLLIAGIYLWASSASQDIFSKTYTAHASDFPIPFPVSEGNIDSPEMALEQAVERGQHLVQARYACTECHGANLGGGVMVDAFPIGSLLGPNLTLGEGSVTRDYTPKEWDLTVRHGILPDGRPSVMPSEDFQKMSDQELSDIVAYIRSQPPVDNTVPASTFGPMGKILVATGKMIPSVLRIESHDVPQDVYPPAALVDATFGAHLAATCTGCHGANLAGGPITGGDPKWPPARNLTPHATGLGDWSYDDFKKAMIEGLRPDGTPVKPPMTIIMPYAARMTPVELEALWVYLRSLPAIAQAIP
jgi:mono/diheme cytochrome c family protein